MKVKDLMSTSMICLDEIDTAARGIQTMVDTGMEAILVVKDGKLTGIVSAFDFVRYMLYTHAHLENLTLREIMIPRPVTVHEMEGGLEAFRRMVQVGRKFIPVVRDGVPVGTVDFASPGLMALLIAAEQNLGFEFDKSRLQGVVDQDFEDELTEYVREEYGTKLFREAKNGNGIEELKDKLREEFRKVYRSSKLNGGRLMEPTELPRERPPFAKALVFVLDDDDSMLALTEWNLRQRGFDVVGFHTPETFLKRLRIQQPDAIVLDWIMPEKNGMEVLQEIRLLPNMRKIPVILATSIQFPAEKNVARGACCVDEYMTKPLNFDTMAACIRKLALTT